MFRGRFIFTIIFAFLENFISYTDLLAQSQNKPFQFTEIKGKYQVNIYEKPIRFELFNTDVNKTILASEGTLILRHIINTNVISKKPYTFFKPGKKIYETHLNKISAVKNHDGLYYFTLGNEQNDSIAILKYSFGDDKIVHLEFSEFGKTPEDISQISEFTIAFESDTSDTYLGMGMRFNTTNHRGSIVTHWADEVGQNLPEITENGTIQGRDVTYAPVPFYINLKGYGLFLNTLNYSEFDFGKSHANQLKIIHKAAHLNLAIYLGETPLEIVGKYFNSNGKFTLPKPWIFGVWAAASTDYQSKTKGEEINYSVLNICRKNQIPISALWAEDWYFDFLSLKPIEDWTVNRKYYPNYEKMISDQHASGVKHLGYYLPYFGKRKLLKINSTFAYADQQGLLTKNKNGHSYVFKFFVWNSTQLDWSNPRAADYFHKTFFAVSEKQGVDGWMNDFGEYTPYKSKSFNGEWGASMHNKYPLLWAKTAHDFFSKTRPDGDYVLFSRSGAAGLHQYNAFIFTGDRNATYDPLSGLGGSITGALNAGISVHPNVSIDIGAYNCSRTNPMNKLMMFRNIELGALIPVMRLHRGVQLCDHWRFDEDTETLMQWKKYARLHARLFPYIYSLANDAAVKGWPMVRHLSLHYPEDTLCRKQDFQFLLGDRILSAPVIDEKLDTWRNDMSQARLKWKVYFPPGNWYHYWTNKKYTGATFAEVPAPPGFLPMFIKEGQIIPTFDKDVDTFVEGVEDAAIKDFEYVNQSVEVLFYGYGEDRFTLWDGTILICKRSQGSIGTFEVENGHGRQYQCTFID